ncbi:unnamed protein product [Allacma fusca]|uniref:G-protein coupled receptors family 1 profile domain-containing protein n=1 Tax=Allacma fusca TaxID=39272 RepID=A0A8J2P5E7_9HEXA|nr:unnamed protein product [Allacma fusca]
MSPLEFSQLPGKYSADVTFLEKILEGYIFRRITKMKELELQGYRSGEDMTYPLCNDSLNNSTDPVYNFTLNSLLCNKSYEPMVFIANFTANTELQKVVSIVVPILFGIIFIVGLFGNALVVIVVASNQQMRNTTNLLIINLAIADLLFIIFCVPFTAADYVLSYWPFGDLWCQTVQYLVIVTAYASVYTLVLMSFDRFLAVVYPVASISIRTEHNTLCAIGVTWIIILVSCLPALFAHGVETYSYAYEEHSVCVFLSRKYNHTIFQISFMLTSYAIPLALICLLYFGMLFGLWRSVSGSGASRQGLRGKKRVTRMIVVVVGVFAICWLPIQVVLLLKSIHMYDINDVTVAIQITSHVLGYMNSCVNPILYAFLSENFRKAFRKVIQCKGVFATHNNNAQMHNNHHEPLVTHVNDHEGPTRETALHSTVCENGGGGNNHNNINTISQPEPRQVIKEDSNAF